MPKQSQSGYTLVELLVVTALLGMILMGVSTLFMQSLFASARNNQRQELRAEGQYAMDLMTTLIRSAKQVMPCGADPNNTEYSNILTVVGADGGTTTFSLESAATGNTQIASVSAVQNGRLTSDAVDISSPNSYDLFSCATNVSQQPYVTIRFIASQQNSISPDPLEQSFRQTVLLRNRTTN